MAEPKTARAAPSFDGGPPQPEHAQPEYLLARSKGPQPFRRAGVTFTPRWNAWRLDELGPERVKAILKEDMVQAQIATADVVHEITAVQGPDPAQRAPSELERLRATVDRQESEIGVLKNQVRLLVERSKLTPP